MENKIIPFQNIDDKNGFQKSTKEFNTFSINIDNDKIKINYITKSDNANINNTTNNSIIPKMDDISTIPKMDDNINITSNNSTIPKTNDNIIITTIKEGNYMTVVNKPAIKNWLLILLIILVVFSITISVFAIQYYDSIEDINIKEETKYLWIMAIINIILTIVCSIALYIYIYIYNNTKLGSFSIFMIILIMIGLGILSHYINTALFIKFSCNKNEQNDPRYTFFTLFNVIYFPIMLIMRILIDFYLIQ
jgi:hypothetical protein